jgi:hypothetical protein
LGVSTTTILKEAHDMTQQLAEAALTKWRDGMRYLGDPDPGASDPREVNRAAHVLTELLISTGITYEMLGVPPAERDEIIRQSLAHEDDERAEDEGWPEAADPPKYNEPWPDDC